jgi:hypothetical protein
MTLLELIQQVTGELGLTQPNMVVGSTDPQIIQFLALLNRLGNDLTRQFDWERLNNEYIINTVTLTTTGDTVEGSAVITNIPDTSTFSTQYAIQGNGITEFSQIESVDNLTTVTMTMPATATATGVTLEFGQVQYSLPDDWMKQIPQTEWDRTNRWPLMGPNTPQEWQSFKSGIVYAGPRVRFRILDRAITLNPIPGNGWVFAYEYISSYWALSDTGVRKAKFTADTDTSIWPDSLLITGLKAQWKASKGLDGTFDFGEFRGLLEQCKAQDKSAKKLSLSPVGTTVLLTTANLPDGFFPSN